VTAEEKLSKEIKKDNGAEREPLRMPEEPLVFDEVDTPSSLKGLTSEAALLRLLKDTSWPWRGNNNPSDTYASVGEHVERKSNGDPLYISQYVNDTKLQRIFQSVPQAFRGARRTPIAVLARPSEGLQLHAIPEPRWLLQLHGRSIWKLARPEDLQRYPPLHGCSPQFPRLAGTCELGPNSLIYVPGKWGWSSCSGGGESLSFAVGAGGYSGEWPDLFHLIAEGRAKQVQEQLEEDSFRVHIGDRLTSHTPMDLAAQIGDLKIAKLLHKHGGRPNDTASATLLHPLHYAALYSHVDFVKWALEQGANPSVGSAEGYHPLHYAAEAGHIPVLEALIGAGADLHAATKLKASPAHLATGAGHLAVLKLLRNAGAELSATDSHGCDPTIWAAKRGDVPLLKFLIDDEGLSKDARCDKRETGAHYAVMYGHTAVLDLLKARKADLAVKDDRKHTPLHVAVELGMLPVIDWFAKAGLKKISPKTPGLLHLAAWRGRIDSLEALLRHGADVHALDPLTKSPAVEYASSQEVYDLLVRHSAKLPEGWVHRAAGRGQLDLLRRLVPGKNKLEASMSEPHDGVYPVHLAAQSAHRDVVKWLCSQMGASCSAKSSSKTYGRTAVHFACVGGSSKDDASKVQTRLEILKYLVTELRLGAADRDDMGITPVELAAVTGHLPLVKYLLLEHKVGLEDIWQAKRAGALNAKVDKWVKEYAPWGMYENWLKLDKPPRRRPGDEKKRRRGKRRHDTAQEL